MKSAPSSSARITALRQVAKSGALPQCGSTPMRMGRVMSGVLVRCWVVVGAFDGRSVAVKLPGQTFLTAYRGAALDRAVPLAALADSWF